MHVCMVTYSFYESDTRILQYTRALVDSGDSVDVISLRSEGARAFELLNGVRVFHLMGRRVTERRPLGYLFKILEFMVLAAFAITRLHLNRRYDVVHVHSVPDFLVFAAIVPKLLGTRVILDIHDILPEFYASKFHVSPASVLFRSLLLCEKLSIAFSDHVIVANELWRDRLVARSCTANKCTAIRNYPDPRIFSPSRRRNPPGNKFRILYPGTLNYHQGLDIAVRAFAKIAEVIPEAEFRIYGQGSETSSLVALRDSLGMTDRIPIEGFIPVEEIAEVMADADLAVVPKRVSTGFGNEAASTKIMEFMALGVPVIVSRTRIDTFYHDNSMVMFVEPEDVEALANAILALYGDPARRRELAEQGLRYVQENNWAAKRSEYFGILDPSIAAAAAVPTGEEARV